MTVIFPNVDALLAAHRIPPVEAEFPNDGYSGARLSALRRGDERFVLKRMRFDDDWLMRLTGDNTCRECEFAVSHVAGRLPPRIGIPTIGAARDGDAWALLMHDISGERLPNDGIVPSGDTDRILAATAALHASLWEHPLEDDVNWCGVDARLTLLSPPTGQMLVDEGRDFGLAAGWRAFERLAPPSAVAVAGTLFADIAPLMRLLDSLPKTLLHGDLKFANMGLDGVTLLLLDWAMVTRATVALEISWFLAVNSGRLPWSLDETLDRYAGHLEDALGRARFAAARWPEQRDAMFLCGLLSYGWGKALDAEAGRPAELAWWCDGAVDAFDRLRGQFTGPRQIGA